MYLSTAANICTRNLHEKAASMQKKPQILMPIDFLQFPFAKNFVPSLWAFRDFAWLAKVCPTENFPTK
jgi:hypothetical protein